MPCDLSLTSFLLLPSTSHSVFPCSISLSSNTNASLMLPPSSLIAEMGDSEKLLATDVPLNEELLFGLASASGSLITTLGAEHLLRCWLNYSI